MTCRATCPAAIKAKWSAFGDTVITPSGNSSPRIPLSRYSSFGRASVDRGPESSGETRRSTGRCSRSMRHCLGSASAIALKIRVTANCCPTRWRVRFWRELYLRRLARSSSRNGNSRHFSFPKGGFSFLGTGDRSSLERWAQCPNACPQSCANAVRSLTNLVVSGVLLLLQ